MANGKDYRKDFKAGTYTVSNSGRRTRVRAGATIPGTNDPAKPTQVDVEVTKPRQLLQLRAGRGLSVQRKAGSSTTATKQEG